MLATVKAEPLGEIGRIPSHWLEFENVCLYKHINNKLILTKIIKGRSFKKDKLDPAFIPVKNKGNNSVVYMFNDEQLLAYYYFIEDGKIIYPFSFNKNDTSHILFDLNKVIEILKLDKVEAKLKNRKRLWWKTKKKE
jgi:hypothetical protein